ncbi:hypothetical protein V6B33_14225 [Mangrovibacillus sp. Mu-81]|uniref:hypothetical protein n=1 Tax=Mangrovibacillus sp. Mu-81 TaxID=3121478 RepID=UPI002FE48F7D
MKKFVLLVLLSTIMFFNPIQQTEHSVLFTDTEQSITDHSYVSSVDAILSYVSVLPQFTGSLPPQKPAVPYNPAHVTLPSLNMDFFTLDIASDSGGFIQMVKHCSNYLSISFS